MRNYTSEQLGQRIHDCHLLETRDLDRVFADLGGRGADCEEFQRELLRRELLTNWQLQRLLEGHRRGFFYGDWKILYLVGAGTFARVYRAAHRKTGDIKAVKVLRNRYSDDADTCDRFLREARTVMKLRHPNIVPIHEVEIENGRTFMVMDFVEGQNLRDYVRAHGRIRLPVALSILRDLSSGLDYASQLGLSHRDIKLSNVLLSSSGRASLVDFGLAAIDHPTDEEQESFTPRSIDYAGLERATHVPRGDKRSDIFFLGCLLYHMVSGHAPLFETRDRIKRLNPQRYRDIPPIVSLVPELPHRVVILLNRMIEFDPQQRIASPGQALREITATMEALRAGHTDSYSPELAKQAADEYARRMRKSSEGQNRPIMVVESRLDVQNALREKLKGLGYRVLIISDPQRALERFEDLDPAEDSPAHCVLFGCAGLGNSGLEAFNRFATWEKTRHLPAILMVERSQRHFVRDASLGDRHLAVEMPVEFREIRRRLKLLLIANVSDDTTAADEAGAGAAAG